MKPLVAFASALSATLPWVALPAQSPLVVAPAAGLPLGWTVPTTDPQIFFDLTVGTTITLQELATPLLSPVGQHGTLELWLTNPGVSTFVGHETDAAAWHLASRGQVVANGTTGSAAQLTCTSCQDGVGGGLVLAPGTYGCAVRYLGVAPRFQAVPSAPLTFANAELSVTGGAIQLGAFTSTPAFPGGGYAGWSWIGELHYAVGAAPHACATVTTVVDGCGERFASIYQRFATAAGAANALNGRSLTFVPNGLGGYEVLPGSAGAAYLPPGPTALQLPLGDDDELQQPLGAPFPYPGGVAASLFVHANGFVSVASNDQLQGFDWIPDVPPFLGAPATGWWIWHDLDPVENGSGAVWFEEDATAGLARVTWLDVESYPTGVVNPSTFQFVFDSASGLVTLHFVALDAIGGAGSPPGDTWVVGYSPGGASLDPGPRDLAALCDGVAGASLTQVDLPPLALAATAPPLLGTTIDLATTNQSSFGLGVLALGTAALAPALELSPLGAPGCAASVAPGAAVLVVLSNGGSPAPGMNVPLVIPNRANLLSARLHAQSAWLDPSANALGLVTSNGLQLQLGNR
ncbi:MAG: hypothetical protein H6835_18415 [Planctomycetes bacterium]|nr:hypothetical protein [Planctomycetota bacterium]